MKQVFLFLFCTLYLSGFLQGQSPVFICPDTGEKGVESAAVQKGEKNVSRRGFNNWAEEHPVLPGESLANAIAGSHQALTDAPLSVTDLDSALTVNNTWGTVYFLDRTVTDAAYPSQFYTKSLLVNDTVTNTRVYDAATFTFYNRDLKEQHAITVDLTQFPYCNDIQILKQFSRQFFNSALNSKLVYIFLVHYFEPRQGPEYQKYATLVIDETGALLTKIDSASGVYLYYNLSNSKIVVDKWEYQQDTLRFEVYNARNFHTAPVLRKTHKFATDVLTNITGPLFGVKRIGTTDYYYFSHYEKPFWKSKNPWEVQEDNSFILDLFNCSNTNAYKTVTLPVIGFTPQAVSSVSFDLSFHDYSLTTNVFNTDDRIELLYGISHYSSGCDCYREKYYLVNEDAEILDSIPLLISDSPVKLADLNGFDTQYALMEQAATGSGIAKIHFFDIQSWKLVNTFDAVHGGELLSLNFERTLIDRDHYACVFQAGNTFTENGNVYSKVNWYHPDGTLYKDVRFNLGPDGVYFIPQIRKSTLDPYLFNDDDKIEYVGAAQTGNGSATVNSLRIYSEDGELLFRADDDPEKGRVGSGLYTVSEGNQHEYFIVSYSKELPDVPAEYNFYKLPFNPFGGGDGTEDNPYIIRSAGDFDLVRRNVTASYAFAGDIDMETLLRTRYASSGWTPVPSFKGKIDGRRHAVRNFQLENCPGGSAALFSELSALSGSKVWIKNLRIADAEIATASTNLYLAFLAGQTSGPGSAGSPDSVYIYNCHVSGNIRQGSGFPTGGSIGGIVGQATNYAGVIASGFEGTIQNTAGAAVNPKVGGIVGAAMTSAYVNASRTKGWINIENGNTTAVGGIAGSVQNGVTVRNSYSSMNLKGGTDVGGVVGSFTRTPKGLIENCYATGHIVAEKATDAFAGGVIGSTDVNNGHISGYYPNQTVNKTGLNMSGLIALNDRVTALYANRVSGKSTDVNSYADFLNGAFTLDSIRHCYALTALKTGPAGAEAAITSQDAGSIDGADITVEDLTEEFYTGIGWAFGNTPEAPWVWNESGQPRLWYEYTVSLNKNELTLKVSEEETLTCDILPEEAACRAVTWESTDTEIATVDNTGKVRAVAEGNCLITVALNNSSLSDTCRVTVTSGAAVGFPDAGRGISLVSTKGKIEISSQRPVKQVDIYDLNGKAVYIYTENANTVSISTARWNKGVYIVKITDNHAVGYHKTVIR